MGRKFSKDVNLKKDLLEIRSLNKEILSKLDAIIQNQKVLYENQIVIFQTLASIGQKVYSQSDFKSLMINMVANGITERVEANDQQRRNI